MSDSLSDDRNARSVAMAALADVAPPRQDSAANAAGLMMLWPVLGADLAGTVSGQSTDGQPAGSFAEPSIVNAAAGPAAGPSGFGNEFSTRFAARGLGCRHAGRLAADGRRCSPPPVR